MEPIESSETTASNTQTPGIDSIESELNLQHGENSNLKSRISVVGSKVSSCLKTTIHEAFSF
jgi:hypothetical protein